MLSEAIKLQKAEYCRRAIEKYKMDKALVFCRTKLDCDNLEDYFTSKCNAMQIWSGYNINRTI